MTKRRLRKQLGKFSNTSEKPVKQYSGSLGIYIDGQQYVNIPDRPGFVYVRLINNDSELIQAHNQTVSPIYELPVIVARGNQYYEIIGRDVQMYPAGEWIDSSSYLPAHGFQHEFDPDNGGGGDLVFVHGEQFYPLMGFPSGSLGANNVLIAPYRYYYNGYWRYAGNTGTPDLFAYKPTGSAGATLVLVYTTASTGNPGLVVGSEFSENITGAAAMTVYVPTNINLQTQIPQVIVRLVTGTSAITWANIYDAKQYYGLQSAGTGTFAGSFLDLNDTPSSYSSQGGKAVQVKSDESGLEFVVPSTGGSGGGALAIYDDGVFVATGTAISFDNGLVAVATGTSVFVSSQSAFAQLGRTVLTVANSVLTIGSIPSGYNSLLILGKFRSDRAGQTVDALGVRFNNISTRVYYYTVEDATSSTWSFSPVITGTSANITNRLPAINAPRGEYGALRMEIPEYLNSGIFITATSQFGSTNTLTATSGPGVSVATAICDQPIAINEIDFISLNGANLVSGSVVTVYGLL